MDSSYLLEKVVLLEIVLIALTFFLTMVAILDFSNCSRISSWYPPDIRSRDTKYITSSEKKTLNSQCRVIGTWLPDY